MAELSPDRPAAAGVRCRLLRTSPAPWRVARRGWAWSTSVAAVALLAGCERDASPTAPSQPATPAVTVTEVVRRSVPHTAEYTASLEAVQQVTLRARVEGFLEERLFTEGDLVQQGDVLYRIDPSQLQADLNAAEGRLADDEAALTKAQTDLARYGNLADKGDVSKETYDKALAEEQEAKAQVAESQAAVEQAKLNLGYSEISAPLSGRIGATAVDVGNLVGPNENAELATIVQLDPIHVTFHPGGADMDAIAARQAQAPVAVTVNLPDGDLPPHQGKIDFIGNRVDAATGTLAMRAVIPNPDGLLLPGRFARVTLDLGEQPDALLVPQRSLVENQGGFLLYVVGADGKVQERSVDVGGIVGALRVVTSGVEAGERVVVDGVQQVQAGQAVTTRPAALPASAPAGGDAPAAGSAGDDAGS